MPRSRSRSPKRLDRRRSRSRERKRKGGPDRHRRSRSRSPAPRYRSRSPVPRRRSRSHSPPRRRSPSPSPGSRRRSPSGRSKRSRESDFREPASASRTPERMPEVEKPKIDEAQLEGLSEEDRDMMAVMGFAGFDTTKGKKVNGNDIYTASIVRKRRYRQYMNRRGGFNRPLDFIA